MPTKAKRLGNMSKHLTKKEREARALAEAEIIPQRDTADLKAPACMSGDNAAKRYWTETVARFADVVLIDKLDTEILAIYCSKLSRRDSLNSLCTQLLKQARKAKQSDDEYLEAVDKLDSLIAKLQSLEQSILQYADKLGLTPSGRSRLALSRAAEIMPTEADDLFG